MSNNKLNQHLLSYHFVTDNAQLALVCDNITSRFVAIDTEFIRTRTFKAQLGLIQLYDGETIYLIDPKTIDDWTPFIALLTNQQIIKLFFACREDIDVIKQHLNVIPSPFFDIQIAATLIGEGLSAGFATLIERYLAITLDKTESQTDWLARPLTPTQCQYAAADAYYLLPLAKTILEKVEANHHTTILTQECEDIAALYQDEADPALAYLQISHAWTLKERHLSCLQKLAAWRLNYARENDLALNFVIHQRELLKIASTLPKLLTELTHLGLRGHEIRLHGKKILEIVKDALTETVFPAPILRANCCPNYKKTVEELKQRIESVSHKHNIPAQFIASRKQIDHYIVWQHGEKRGKIPDLGKGWRQHYCQL